MSNHNKPRHHPQQQKPQQVTQQVSASFYQGVIPKAEELERYEQISPGFASRIIKMTEDEITHRRGLEKQIIRTGARHGVLGQLLGFVSVLSVCYLCYLFLINGAPVQGAWIAVGVLVSIAGAYLFRKRP